MKITQIAQQQIIIALTLFFCTISVSLYAIGPTAAVVIAGAKIKARKTDNEKKYPRSKCPVCKGTGKVKEGDGTVEVIAECPHCYPDRDKNGDLPDGVQIFSTEDQEKIDDKDALTHPPVIINSEEPQCKEGKCEPKSVPKIPQKPTTIYRR